jgi:hypothetical protein
MLEFIGGILFIVFILFLGIKVKKVKLEYGDFKEEKNTGTSSSQPRPGTKLK